MITIHPTAIVGSDVTCEDNVTIGPYSIVSGHVTIGAHTVIKSHVVITGNTMIGKYCTFFPFCSIGEVPQDLKYEGEESNVIIGTHNIFREYVTVNKGTKGGGGGYKNRGS